MTVPLMMRGEIVRLMQERVEWCPKCRSFVGGSKWDTKSDWVCTDSAEGGLIMGTLRRVMDDDTAASQTIRRTIYIPERLHKRIQWVRGSLLKDAEIDISYSDFLLHFLFMAGLGEFDNTSNSDKEIKEFAERLAQEFKKQGWKS